MTNNFVYEGIHELTLQTSTPDFSEVDGTIYTYILM